MKKQEANFLWARDISAMIDDELNFEGIKVQRTITSVLLLLKKRIEVYDQKEMDRINKDFDKRIKRIEKAKTAKETMKA